MDKKNSFEDFMPETKKVTRKATKIGQYDFKETEKFSADQHKFLEKLFMGFGENLTAILSPLLQGKVQIHLSSIQMVRYHHYINSLPDSVTIVDFQIDPESRGFISLDYALCFGILDKLMGGKGKPLDTLRYFTDLEKALLNKTAVKFIDAYNESWREVKDVRAQFRSTEFNPLTVQIMSPSDTMVVAEYHAHIAQAKGLLNLCLSYKYLRDAVPKASFDEFLHTRTTQFAPAPSMTPYFAKNLEGAKVPISVVIGKAEVLFSELLGLEKGDTIKLDNEIDSPFKIRVNERTKFLARPGLKDNKIALQVTKVLNEEDEEFEE